MKNLLIKSYQWYKNNSHKKVKGMSAIEMVFFLLGCSVLCLLSYEIFGLLKKNTQNIYKTVKEKQENLESKIKKIQEDNLDFNQ